MAEVQAEQPWESDVGRLAVIERAARQAGESAAHWWGRLTRQADADLEPLDDLFREALASIRQALRADTISMLLADEDGTELVARASLGLEDEVHGDVRIRAGQGMAGRVLATRRPLVVDDLEAIELASPVLRESGLRSVVAVPLLAGDRLLGVLHTGSRQLRHFGPADAELLTLVAARLATAMERMWLLEVERTARHRAEELSDRLLWLQAVTSALARATDVGHITRIVGETFVERGDGRADAGGVRAAADQRAGPGAHRRRATLWLVPEDTAWSSADAAPLDGVVAATPADVPPPVAAVLRGGLPVVVEVDPAPPEGWTGPVAPTEDPGRPAAGDGGPTSTAVLPVTSGGRVVGALEVSYGGSHHFGEEERGLLAVVADQVAQALDRVRLLSAQERLVATSGFLADAARVLAEANGYQAALEQLSELGLAVLGDICLIDVVDDDASLVRMVARHRDPERQVLVDRLHSDYPPDPGGSHPALDVIRTGRSRWSPDMSGEFMAATTRSRDHLALTRALGFRSYLSVPLRAPDSVLGALTLISAGRPFAPDDVSFAEALAGQVAAVVDGARRYERAFHTSRILQDHLLPRQAPEVPGVRIHAQYLAATRGVEIGGDFFDAWQLRPGRVALVIGDVAGHDREAAAMMGQLRSASRAVFDEDAVPAEVVAYLSAGWDRMGFDRIATALYGLLDTADGTVTFASAGHYPPLLVAPGRATFTPVPPNLPLGAGVDRPVASWSGHLADGAVLLLYTDGAIQERQRGIEEGMARLAQQAVGGAVVPRLLCQRVVADLPPPRRDDVALLAVTLDRAAT